MTYYTRIEDPGTDRIAIPAVVIYRGSGLQRMVADPISIQRMVADPISHSHSISHFQEGLRVYIKTKSGDHVFASITFV
ncbi:hypothetical protein A3H77_01445 [Candidatus Kaiserbacteria bacterium RIFCSPLOWO2_02_FULL_56_11]|uniref:Uncharacterized protein n=1 Tax=Candidatus Kaiserbacteria bacterium RIFCSPHIGHO2_12_FULL_56_13 TaxID=1798505 RepID=A0A1F6EEJ0_9BACT|nr:MAG: hypothetical protein A3E65_00215 [Candidatus Kaiserbacteria bacterium RIFCSPHIGHO2_12_FULL_56_13]OGG82335.1 MAG: hypothetical protein A3H77_01445 [Candidatus Kaiserbacteria bacterium RIFCSPLOWO2_02_FULL_56_11]